MGWRPQNRGSRSGDAPHSRRHETLQTLVLFAAFYLYLWLVIEPRLLFHGAGTITDFPSFYTGWPFLREHLSYPGGPAWYLSAFLSQLFYFSWLGALVATLQAWALGLCIAHLLRATELPPLRLASHAPAVLLVVLYGRYAYYFPTLTALLIALAFACGYAVLTRSPAPLRTRLAVFTLMALASYYIAGGAFLLFASLCAICELAARGRRSPLLYAALGAMLPYVVGVLGFDMSAPDAYTRLLPISWRVLRYVERSRLLAIPCTLYLLPPLAMASGVAWRKLRPTHRPDRTRPQTSPGRHARRSRLRWVGQTLALLGIGVAAGFAGFDPKEKTRFAVDYHAYHRNWPQVLTAGKHHPDHRVVMHAVNRALYHSGRLGDEMFRWPQSPGNLFLIGTGHEWVHWQSFDVHLEMGLVNLAEHSLTHLRQ